MHCNTFSTCYTIIIHLVTTAQLLKTMYVIAYSGTTEGQRFTRAVHGQNAIYICILGVMLVL